MESDRYGVAEYFVDEVRNALLLDQVPSGPVDAYLLPGPSVPLSVSAGDGISELRRRTRAPGVEVAGGGRQVGRRARTLPLADITAVEWQPTVGLENGHLRFTVRAAPTKAPPKYDHNAVELWGFKRDPLMALVAAAVQARLPHPAAPAARAALEDARPAEDTPAPAPATTEDDHDALLRRLRELGELHRSGVLTDEEFTPGEAGSAETDVATHMRHACPESGRILAKPSLVPQDLPGARRTR